MSGCQNDQLSATSLVPWRLRCQSSCLTWHCSALVRSGLICSPGFQLPLFSPCRLSWVDITCLHAFNYHLCAAICLVPVSVQDLIPCLSTGNFLSGGRAAPCETGKWKVPESLALGSPSLPPWSRPRIHPAVLCHAHSLDTGGLSRSRTCATIASART